MEYDNFEVHLQMWSRIATAVKVISATVHFAFTGMGGKGC